MWALKTAHGSIHMLHQSRIVHNLQNQCRIYKSCSRAIGARCSGVGHTPSALSRFVSISGCYKPGAGNALGTRRTLASASASDDKRQSVGVTVVLGNSGIKDAQNAETADEAVPTGNILEPAPASGLVTGPAGSIAPAVPEVPAQEADTSIETSALESSNAPTPADDKRDVEQPTQMELHSNEFKKIVKLAVPLALQNTAGYALSVICMLFIGRLGAETMSAAVLANSVYSLTGLSIALGLSAGIETLCGQAYGAKDYKTLGLVLQRAVLVCWSVCVPIGVLWYYSGPVMVALGQQPALAATACRYLALCIPCLFLSVTTECIKKFLQAQRVVRPSMIMAGLTTVIAPLYFYLIVFKTNLGLDGAAFAFIACQVTNLAGLLAYTTWRSRQLAGKPEQTWGGFSMEAFKGWKHYLSYGIPAAAMICLEWWAFECIILMAGVLPSANVALAAMGTLMSINTWGYMIPLGLASAVNTSMANAMGSGDPGASARVFRSGFVAALALQVLVVGCVLLAKQQLVQMFCPDPTVVSLAVEAMPVLGALMFLDGVNALLAGVLRGSGRQLLGAMVNVVCCAVGIPTAWLLAYKLDLGVPGFWGGVAVGGAIQAAVILSLIMRWDWGKEVARVQAAVAGRQRYGEAAPAVKLKPA